MSTQGRWWRWRGGRLGGVGRGGEAKAENGAGERVSLIHTGSGVEGDRPVGAVIYLAARLGIPLLHG